MGNAANAVRQGVAPGSVSAALKIPTCLPEEQARTIRTIVFLDVDGVLNIGVYDTGEAPMLFNEANVSTMKEVIAMQMSGEVPQMSESQSAMIAKMAAVNHRKADCVVDSKWQLSEALIGRLVKILSATERPEDVAVVLASTWRRPAHADKVVRLQQEVSRLLGRDFVLDAKLEDRQENSAADRLEAVADFLVNLSNQRSGVPIPLHALVLEDFFITGMDGWQCGPSVMNSVADAEGYLLSRVCASASTPVQAKLLHCYEEWTTSSGTVVKIGGGLTDQLVDDALAFMQTE